ncbi:retrovirus-related pol polyprotein from transposon TNT 1-94 [Tanacetum coccineum]
MLVLPKMFWEDSVTTAAYLINRGPSVPLGFRIPKKEWQGKEVSLAHLRVFGCDSYVEMKDVARDKLDAKSVKCKFIGNGLDEMGYRFWDSKSHMVVRSRDVTFNEDSLYGAKAATDSSNLTKPIQKDQVVLEDSLENLANKSILSRIVEDSYEVKTMKTEHPSRREAPRLHSYKDSSESPGIRQLGKKKTSCMSQEFKMKDLGLAKQILGMSVIRDKTKGTLRLSDV